MKYKANFSNSSSNGIIGGIESNNLREIVRDIKEITKGNGGGNWWVEDSEGRPVKSGRI